MILYSAKRTAVHDMHLSAIAEYARAEGVRVRLVDGTVRMVSHLIGPSGQTIFSQSTGSANLVVFPLARLRGKRIFHYMHEPTPLGQKLRENSFVKSILWHAVQWVEARMAARILVSREELAGQASAVYGIGRERIAIAPLLMPQAEPYRSLDPRRVTYLGRIDERRYFQSFLDIAPSLATRGYRPTILTGDVANLRAVGRRIPDAVEIVAERNFSEILKTCILAETRCLWNPKRGAITQSGVTADAIRYGTAILLTDKDPACGLLTEAGIAFDFDVEFAAGLRVLDWIDAAAVARRAAKLFSLQHGAEAFTRSYAPLIAD